MTPLRSLLLACACACACAALFGCDAELYHALGERQANHAVLCLREAGIAADKRQERGVGRGAGFTLTVPRADETRALQLLQVRGLPRQSVPQEAPGLLPLPEEQRQQQAAALGEQLAVTLESLPQVLEARVHLTLPSADPLRQGAAPRPGAAVLLRLRANLPMQTGEVAQLVARSVAGLDPADVTVLFARMDLPQPSDLAVVRVGPLWVAPTSQRLAAALLGGLCLLGAGCLLLLLRRRRPD